MCLMLKEKILELKEEGLGQSEIALKLGCAKSTVCWHFDPDKQLKKAQDRKKRIPDYEIKNCRNISRFFCSKTENKQKIKIKNLTFKEAHATNRNRLKNFSKHYKWILITHGMICFDLSFFEDIYYGQFKVQG